MIVEKVEKQLEEFKKEKKKGAQETIKIVNELDRVFKELKPNYREQDCCLICDHVVIYHEYGVINCCCGIKLSQHAKDHYNKYGKIIDKYKNDYGNVESHFICDNFC